MNTYIQALLHDQLRQFIEQLEERRVDENIYPYINLFI